MEIWRGYCRALGHSSISRPDMPDLIATHRTACCGNLGYRFDADQVELQADIAGPVAGRTRANGPCSSGRTRPSRWPNCRSTGSRPTNRAGSGSATQPPAGDGFHQMSLKLVSGRPGDYAKLHDQQTFGLRQGFVQPRLLLMPKR